MHSATTSSMMAGEGKPLFHDFLGMSPSEPKHTEGMVMSCVLSRTPPHSSRRHEEEDLNRDSSTRTSSMTSERHEVAMACSTPPLLTGPLTLTVAGCSESGSERVSWENCTGHLAHSDKSAFCRPEADGRTSVKKRDSPISNSSHLLQDRFQMGADTLEKSRGFKMSRLGMKDDKRGRQSDIQIALDDFHLPMQPPRQMSNCLTSLQPSMHKPDLMTLNKWERPVLLNKAAYVHSHPGQFRGYPDKNCSNSSGDNSTVLLPLSRPAADEGSRTGIQVPGLASLISNVPSSTSDRSTTAAGVPTGGARYSSRSAGSESTMPKSHQIAASPSRQLTVFYGGQAHVFDDVPPIKADAIMALAGSNGRSWSTTYSPRRRQSECDVSVPALEREKSEKKDTRGVRMGP